MYTHQFFNNQVYGIKNAYVVCLCANQRISAIVSILDTTDSLRLVVSHLAELPLARMVPSPVSVSEKCE